MKAMTANKKNEHFFKELDKDRRRGCEYAILALILEADSELYNSGIVDVSYAYGEDVCYPASPFLPHDYTLRNVNSLQYKQNRSWCGSRMILRILRKIWMP